MEALKLSFVPSLHIATTPTGTISYKTRQHLYFNSCSLPTSHVASNRGHVRSVEVFNNSPSSASTVLTHPDQEEAESDNLDGEGEDKFDWYAQWYPIMPACDLDKRVPHAKTVMGIDVVVWWDRNEGAWKVFHDTCPHRLAPLSEGRIDQWGRLQCVYHGWCFNGSGDCKLIPQAPRDGPPVHSSKKACASVFPSTEQNGIVWFWPNSDPKYKDILLHKKPPYVPELDDPSFVKATGVREFPFGYEILIENLMDPAHVPYAHFKLLPNPPSKNRVKLDREGGGPLDITVVKLDKEGFRAVRTGGQTKFAAPCVYSSAFSLPPIRKVADKGNGSVSSSENHKGPSSDTPLRRGMLLFYCVPVGPGKSRLIYAFPRNFGVWISRIIPRWVLHLQQNLVLDSDLYLLHIEERKIMEIGPSNWLRACFVPTKSDGHVVAFRKWLRKYSGGQIDWGGKVSTELLPTPPKEQLMDRYWSHVVNCSSCNAAYKSLNALEVALQIFSIISIGIVAATKHSLTAVTRISVVSMAVLCFAASRWLAHFIYKNFHFHDYNHALL